MKHKINYDIFKSCDVRGKYGIELFDNDFYEIGKAFSTYLLEDGGNSVCLGRDGRSSSFQLHEALIKGLKDSGLTVYDVGLVSSPALYFSMNFLKTDASLMITASHNPAVYNGLKFALNDKNFDEKNILIIKENLVSKNYKIEENAGKIININIKQDYINFLLSKTRIDGLENYKFVWDLSNGASAFCFQDFINHFSGKHIIINGEINGTFPGHAPDPSKQKNLAQLQKAVIDNNANIGFCFDGDGDRVCFVDNTGRCVTGDQAILILAKQYLAKNKGSKVISEVKASKVLYSEIKRLGGIPIIWKVGHTNQKSKMRKDKIGFGGETSGHQFYSENHYFDDGIYSSIKLLDYIIREKKTSLSEEVDSIPKVYTSHEIRLPMNKKDQNILMEKVYKELKNDNRTFLDIDGFRVDFQNGFWLIRKSNTQPHITTYAEGTSIEEYKACLNDLKEYISKAGYDYDLLKE